MHRPGIVGQQDTAKLEQSHELTQRGFTRQVEAAYARDRFQLVAESPIVRAAENQPETIRVPARYLTSDGSKTRDRPALRGAVFRPRIHAEQEPSGSWHCGIISPTRAYDLISFFQF